MRLIFEFFPIRVIVTSEVHKGNPPCSSINVKAFSKNEGVPSTSSKASKIGRPITVDLAGSLSFTVEAVQKIHIKGKKKVTDFYSIKRTHHTRIHNKGTLQMPEL